MQCSKDFRFGSCFIGKVNGANNVTKGENIVK